MPQIRRRSFIFSSAAAIGSLGLGVRISGHDVGDLVSEASNPPAFSITPVIGDGKWIWRDPPTDTGYLETVSYTHLTLPTKA